MKEDLPPDLQGLERFVRRPIKKDRLFFVIRAKDKQGKKFIWRDLCFDDMSLAQFFFDQELFAVPAGLIPKMHLIEEVSFMVAEKLWMYQFPSSIKVVFFDFFAASAMSLKLEVQMEDIPNVFYASSWSIMGNAGWINTEDDKLQFDRNYQTFGIRLRPACFSPKRTKYISMRDEGLPGLWYLTIGYRKDTDAMASYDNDDLHPCVLCPYDGRKTLMEAEVEEELWRNQSDEE